MLRAFLTGLCLFAMVGFVAAEEKKDTKVVTGTFKSYKDGTLTILVKGKKGEEPKATEIKVAKTAKLTVLDGENKADSTVDATFTDKLKEGTPVKVESDADGKITAITVGSAKKAK